MVDRPRPEDDPTLDSPQPVEEERQGILEPLQQGNLGQAALGLGQMLTPRAGLPGQRGLGDIFTDFVEFSPLGDIGDVHAAIDPNSGLDPLERIIAASPFLGVGAVGARSAYKRFQARHQQGLSSQTSAASMQPPPGESYNLEPDSWEDLGGVAPSPEQQRFQVAKFEQMRLESQSPFSRATLRAENWDELAVSVSGQEINTDGVKRVQDSLRQVGAAVVSLAPDPKLYGTNPETQQFVAAKVAVTKWNRAMELGIVDTFVEGRSAEKQTQLDLALDNKRIDNIVKIAQFEAATAGIVGPDLTLPTPGRLAQVTFDERTGEPRVFYGIVDGLLPTERAFDWDTMYPYDSNAVRRRQQQVDFEAVEGVGASNIARALQLAPEEAIADPETWYRNYNRTARSLSERTGYSVNQVSGVIAAMSANTPWIPNNLVGAVHVVLQSGTDLRPGTPEYVDAFREATVGSGWAFDMFEDSSLETQSQFEQMSGAPGGIPDFEGLMSHYADPENVTSPEGRMTGAEDQTKQDKIDMILKGNVPPWLVLRGMKTNTFGRLGSDPSLVDLVVTDTWNDRIFWGTLFTDTPLAFDGYTAKTEIDPDQTYHDPITGEEVSGREVLDGIDKLAADHGWTKDQVKRWKALLTSFPTKTAQARFLAQARAHLLVRDEFGMPSGHSVQAPAWLQARLSWDGLTDRISESMSRDELRRVAQEGHLDTILFSHIEGNPAMERTAAGMVWNVDPTLVGTPPLVRDLKAAKSGAQREASSRVSTSIIAVGNPDGSVTPYADVTTDGVRETLRHATPSGVKVGDWERFIANRPRQVLSSQDHVTDLQKYRREDGRLAAGHVHVTYDPESPGHPAMLPGDRVVVLVPKDSANRVEAVLNSEYPFDYRTADTRSQRLGVARNQLVASDIQHLTDEQLGNVLQENDWVAITAHRGENTAGQNWDAMRRLKLDIEKRGGHAIDADGRYPGAEGVVDEPSFFVTGLSYKDALELGRKYNQEAVATRWGMLNSDGTYHPVKDKPSFGDAVDENSHTRLSTGQTFSFDYEWATSLALPEDVDTVADQTPRGEPMREVTVELGGEYGGANWNVTDRLLKKLHKIPGARMRVYSHSPNRVPENFIRASESVFTDQSGITGSVLHRVGDEYARHHADVYIPEWESHTLSDDGFGPERSRRSELDARQVMEIDEAAGMIWFDKDLAIQVDPEANVSMADKGAVFRSLKVDGSLVREVIVDTNGPVPIIDASGVDALPAPGRTVVQLSRGTVKKVLPHTETDFAEARDALASAGLVPDGESVTVEYPSEGPEGAYPETLKLSYRPHPEYGKSKVLGENQPTAQADIDTTARVQEIVPTVKKVVLGENAHPDLHRQVVSTLEDLHAASGPSVIPGKEAVKRWDEIADDEWIEVYHSTTPEVAEQMLEGGVVASQKAPPMLGEGGPLVPGNEAKGLFVGVDSEFVGQFKGGRGFDAPSEVLVVRVRKGEIVNPPQSEQFGLSLPRSLAAPNGGVIYGDIPARQIRRLGESPPVTPSQSSRLPGVDLVGPLPPGVWDKSFGINTATVIDRTDMDAMTMMEDNFRGVVFNERQIVTRWNRAARPADGYRYGPETATDFEATLVHEVGHMVEARLRDTRAGIGQRPGIEGFVDKAKQELGGTAGVRLHLSKYATESNQEFFAEAYAKVMFEGENAHPALVELVSDVMKTVRQIEEQS